jgi:3-oxoacyl-[acyl-carrier protein] reductase
MKANSLSLQGRRSLVCGASQGIGEATAFSLAEQGAEVVVLARSKDKLEKLIKKLVEAGAPKAFAVSADLQDLSNLRSKIQNEIEQNGPIQILVNNSGGPPPGPILEAKNEDFIAGFTRHILAANTLVQLCLSGMKDARYGRIINIISTSVKEPIAGLGVSNTIRGAMAAWAKTLANELPPGITINNVLPGYTATPRLDSLRKSSAEKLKKTPKEIEEMWTEQIPERRVAQPEELSNVIAFLASPAASYVRGVSLAVDGGRMRSI